MFEVFEGGDKTDSTDVYVVSPKDGEVHGPFEAPYAYSAHHINAYEKSEEVIVLDFCPTPWENFREVIIPYPVQGAMIIHNTVSGST